MAYVIWWQPGLGQLDRYQSCHRVVIVGVHVHLGSTIMDVSVFSTLHRHIKQVTRGENKACPDFYAGAGAKP